MHTHCDVQAPWDGVLETVWLLATKTSRLDACEDRKIVRWCRTQTSIQSSQGVFGDRVNEVGVSMAAPDKSAVLLLNVPGIRWLFTTLLLQHPSNPPQERKA